MKRFKLTPEVVVKSFLSFLFGAIVGFLSFLLATRFSPNFVSALNNKPKSSETVKEPTEENFEKTLFPFELETVSEKGNLSNNADAVDVYLKTYPNIEIEEESGKTEHF